jgi:amidase
MRPLHGIAVIVKDNYDTEGLQTTGGSLAMKGFLPVEDAFMVKRLREAGAIILAKSNMAEWAFSPYVTMSSIAGTTRNPYDLERVPAGSSGGTGAAVAASLGEVGLGTDGQFDSGTLVTQQPCWDPARDGINQPGWNHSAVSGDDIGGPMARTVADAAAVLGVVAGYDPADPITALSQGNAEKDYTKFLERKGIVNPAGSEPYVKPIGTVIAWTISVKQDSQLLGTLTRSGKSVRQRRAHPTAVAG